MGKMTSIAWCDSTLSLSMGCSAGCELAEGHCYAESLCHRMAGRKGYPKDFRKPELFLHRLDECLRWTDLTGTARPDKPWLNNLPRVVFLNMLGETFDPALPADWLAYPFRSPSVISELSYSPHVFIILTKRPQRMAEFSQRHPFPSNVWAGVSVTAQRTADERIPWLLETQANMRIVSAEPLLGPINLSQWNGGHPLYETTTERTIRLSGSSVGGLGNRPGGACLEGCSQTRRERKSRSDADRVSLCIIGGESGHNARPCNVKWIRSLVDQAKSAGVPCFVKQDSGPRPGMQGQIPDDLLAVKEMPKPCQPNSLTQM
jgi:protein gp37